MGGRNRVGAAAIRGVQKQPGPRLQEPVYSQEGQSVGGREGFSAMTRIPDDSICARSVGEREAWTGCPSEYIYIRMQGEAAEKACFTT